MTCVGDAFWVATCGGACVLLLCVHARITSNVYHHMKKKQNKDVFIVVTLSPSHTILRHKLTNSRARPHACSTPPCLHTTDQLFSLGSEHVKLRERIAQLGEEWWKKGVPGKEQLVPQTISYLLMRSMQPDARKSDIKRVNAFRDSLLLIDLADPSAELLKGALLQCAVSPTFLDSTEGKKFLSYVFYFSFAFFVAVLPFFLRCLVRLYCAIVI